MSTIAGHTFSEGISGRVCTCGRRWADISGATRDDIGKMYIAHAGSLNEREFQEIVEAKERLWRAAMGRSEAPA